MTIVMRQLTAFQRDILFVIASKQEPHGLSIKQTLETLYDIEIFHGRLYPNLDTLVEKGFVEKGQLNRRTNAYSLTDEGLSAMKEHVEWQKDIISYAENSS